MSGHSKWSTIKRKKEATDSARGSLFSKLSKAISVAIVQGGGANPDTNYKLKVAIDAAKEANMPKINIERLLKRASEQKKFSELVYEGFAPGGVGVLVDVITDNKNRSSQEIKGIFDRMGGSVAGPGSVSFNFEPKGLVVVEKSKNSEEQQLQLIDLGVEDFEETNETVEIYVDPKQLSELKDNIEGMGMKILSSELTQKPKMYAIIDDPKKVSKILKLIDSLEDQDDVSKVYSNFDASEETINQAASL
jgi:YebC/PmpR family DNA-binding regulatory protein